jgi:hypothetical protein
MKRPEPTAATPPPGGPPAVETRGLTNVVPARHHRSGAGGV